MPSPTILSSKKMDSRLDRRKIKLTAPDEGLNLAQLLGQSQSIRPKEACVKKLSLSLATILVLLGMAAPASGQVVITGYLQTGAEPVEVDSAYLKCPSESTWFLTADWHCDTMATDTFVFPPFALFPAEVTLAAKFNGVPLLLDFPGLVRQVWSRFPDPHDQTQVMFDAPTGIEEGRYSPAGLRLAVSPSLIRDAAVILTSGTGRLEIMDAAGNTVRTFPAAATVHWSADDAAGRALPEGIYFCRLAADQTAVVRKLIISR